MFLGRQAALLPSPVLPSLSFLLTPWEEGLAWPSPCLLYFIQYKQPLGGAFSVAWSHTHTHTDTQTDIQTHTHTLEPSALLLLGTPSTPSDVSGGQWCRDAGGQGQEATWLQA